MKVSIRITDSQFSSEMKEDMWNLYRKYYNYSKMDFMDRISRNNLFSIYEFEGKLVGFTGLRMDRTVVNGKRSLLIYFGQTVIDRSFRGKGIIPFTGLKLCFKYFKDLFFSDIYFWCDALTYKSYLVCAKSLSKCYPSRSSETPEEVKRLISYLGYKHYKDSFCEQFGTIVKATNLVKDPTVMIDGDDAQDKDIQFFMRANPHHTQGHGLLTIAPLNLDTFLKVAQRLCTSKISGLIGRSMEIVLSLLGIGPKNVMMWQANVSTRKR